MQTIFPLPDDVIAKIAAGEVIERPCYCVKELIENSLDAQATRIIIEILDAGFERITVSDNGSGMSEDDLINAARLHTTSKIQTLDDLNTIHSLGFRGEALASMAAVAQLTIESRTADSAIGLQWENKNQAVNPVGMPTGTRISVEHLFADFPARHKFMKSKQTERRLITEIVSAYAIAHPRVSFRYSHEKKMIFDLHPESLLERYDHVIGRTDPHAFLPIQSRESYGDLSGFIAKPKYSTSSTRGQFFIVNGRPISDRLLSAALKEAYGTLLPRDLYPTAMLFLTVPVQMIDANVHPRKEQISFAHPTHLYDQLVHAVTSVLQEHDLSFTTDGWKTSLTQTETAQLLREHVLPAKKTVPRFDFTTLQQWHTTYITIQTDSGVLFFDQHAVHERILYEQFLSEWKKQEHKHESYILRESIQLVLSPSETEMMNEQLEFFEQLGFQFVIHDSTVEIIAAPSLLRERDLGSFVRELLDQVRSTESTPSVDRMTQKMIAYLACRSAVKAGDVLTKKKMRNLLETLFTTPNCYTCPHGRPTMIETKKNELDRLFKRS